MFEMLVYGGTVLSLVAVAVAEFAMAPAAQRRPARPQLPAAPSARVVPMPQRSRVVPEALRKAA